MKATRAAKPEQLPLDLRHDAATGRDDLVISDPVSAAASIIDRWPDWASSVVIITGPEGSGKSHLAQVWRRKSGAKSVRPVAGSGAIEAAGEGPVLIEDADREGFDETELFHLINAVRSAGTSLLITARSWPLAWGVKLPDLVSRLKAATTVEIGAPDDMLLSQILVKLFADRQLQVDDKLVAYIVSRMERSLAAAQTIVERLDTLGLSRGSRISRALAAEVMGALSEREDD
ncbi:DnaA regulatory inactivator HdaA [Rhizobium sp. LjRoot254]|uniref:DnaA regulatory inactivator HdaA n=1 Tax=Rhizobium sp. LjRoot254 TaxID=3342297 RepID=UPI003ECF1824